MTWLLLTIASAFLLGFYDTFLLQTAEPAPGEVQAWFTIYTSLITGVILLS